MSEVLAVAGLHAGYSAGDILKGIDASVPRGAVVTVIGPNGSGKSTLIKTLAGLLPARQGEIVLDGERMNDLSAPRRVRAGMSYVPQEYNVFRNLTVLENLKIAREFMRGAASGNGKVLDDELLALFPELPGKFRALAGNLSGGQRQMLAFACALKYMADIFETVKKVNARGVSVFMIEQNATEALRISDTCIVMANGRVRMTAPASEVLDREDLHSLYLGEAH